MQTAIELCCLIEPLIRPNYHCALTGSRLYGLGEKAIPDIDIVIYPNATNEGRLPVDAEIIRTLLRPLLPEIVNISNPDYNHAVLRAFWNGNQCDFLLIP